MAKLGERDARWIVEDRGAEGTNVHGWHWQETDCLAWTNEHFERRFEKGVRAMAFDRVKVDGEAYVNRRKGKIICGYELEISAKFALVLEGNETMKGRMKVPYVGDENRGEAHEVIFTVDDADDADAKNVIDERVKKEIVELIHEWEDLMAKGAPCMKSNDEGRAEEEPKKEDGQQKQREQERKQQQQCEYMSTPLSKTKHTIKLKETFLCRASDVCEALLDPKRVQHYTRANASGQVGLGKFLMFDGNVTGETIEFEMGKLIKQKWRFNSWPENHYSVVEMKFTGEDGNVVLTLVQSEVPECDAHGNENVIEVAKNGWTNLIFARIKNAFGYGAFL